MTSSDRGFFGHPSGLSTLFFTEMWERFSYYGMRAILILFMVAPVTAGGMGMPVPQAGAVQGTYSAMVYLMTMVGGWFADKLLGLRRSVFWGGVLIMCGHISLAFPGMGTFYAGLILVVFGTGLLKGNVSAMVGQLYAPEDTRRDAAFSIYYMGVNLGGFLGPLVSGWLAQQAAFKVMLANWGLSPEAAWHFGFGSAAVGMFFGLIQYVLGRNRFPDVSNKPAGIVTAADATHARRQLLIGIAVVLLAVLGTVGLANSGVISVTPGGVATAVDLLLVVITIGLFGWMFTSAEWSPDERTRLVVVAVLFLGSTIFWAGFEQGASTLNLFAERNTANTFLGWAYPSSWLQSANSAFIILFAPVVGAIWLALGRRNPSSPTKFSLGLVFLALAYALMLMAALTGGSAKVSPAWLLGCYFLQTIGELCISPVGMSAISTLAPARVQGFMMGVWFLSISIGNKIAGRVGGLYESFSLPALFGTTGGFVLVFAVVLALLVVPIRNMLARRAA